MSAWINDYIRINPNSRPGRKLSARRKGIVHYTANHGATAKNHVNYFNNLKDRFASAHIFVDKFEARCIIPLDEVAYAANDGVFRGIPELKPNANHLSISVEMCQEKDGSIHPDTIARTEDVFVTLSKMLGWNPLKDIVRHYDVTRKNCPAPWVTNSKLFEDFKKRVNAKLNGNTVTYPAPNTSVKSEQIKTPNNKVEWVGTNDKGKRIEAIASSVNYYDTQRWTNPTGQFKKGAGWIVDNLYRVDGSLQYRVQNSSGKLFYITARKDLVRIVDNKSSSNKSSSSVSSANLRVDGHMDYNTIVAMQRYFGTPVDGKLSKPSLVVKALQKLLGVKQDGYMGRITISAMQKRFGTPVDGKISKPSLMVKELQRRLNKGKL